MQKRFQTFDLEGGEPSDPDPLIKADILFNVVTSREYDNLISFSGQASIYLFALVFNASPGSRNTPKTRYGNPQSLTFPYLKESINKWSDSTPFRKKDKRPKHKKHEHDGEKPVAFSEFQKFPEFSHNSLFRH